MTSGNHDREIINKDFFILTGGPGTGKTVTLNELSKRNYRCINERAREVIKEQAKKNLDSPQWRRSSEFAELTFARSLVDYMKCNSEKAGITFFDRGIPETCYGTESSDIAAELYRYNRKVFIFPPWKEIYINDKERIQTFEEAIEVYKIIKSIYKKHEYKLIEVPKLNIEQRADFIIEHCTLTIEN